MGGRMDLNDGVDTMSMDGVCRRDPLPGLSRADRRSGVLLTGVPNFMIAPHPDYVLTHTLWPWPTIALGSSASGWCIRTTGQVGCSSCRKS